MNWPLTVAALIVLSLVLTIDVGRRRRALEAVGDSYPQYGFGSHKGYGTAAHMAALAAHGPCPEHRYSFAPVARAEKLREKLEEKLYDQEKGTQP